MRKAILITKQGEVPVVVLDSGRGSTAWVQINGIAREVHKTDLKGKDNEKDRRTEG